MSTAKDDIVYWSLGDWLDLKHGANGWGPGLTPIALTSTAASYYLCNITAENALLLAKEKEASHYKNQAAHIKNVFNDTFLNKKTGWYAKNSQTGQAIPLFLGLVPEEMEEQVIQRLIEAIQKNNNHTSTGFIGVIPMLKYLSETGHIDLVYKMLTQENSPGWLHFVKDERSTMGENLNAAGYGTSHHPFAANIGFWLYQYLGGIHIQMDKTPHIILQPGFETDLQWVHTSYEALQGTIVSNWEKTADHIQYHIEIPTNSTAMLQLPEAYVISDRTPEFKIVYKTGQQSIIIPSGKYDITISKQ